MQLQQSKRKIFLYRNENWYNIYDILSSDMFENEMVLDAVITKFTQTILEAADISTPKRAWHIFYNENNNVPNYINKIICLKKIIIGAAQIKVNL